MRARVNNAIHVQVEIVKLFAIRICFGRINWDFFSVDIARLVFDDWRYDLGVLSR